MKKLIIILSCLIGALMIAQTTNNLQVVLPSGADAEIKAAWQYDTQLRTNGIAPYTNALPAQTFKAFTEGIASDALSEKIERIRAVRESEMLKLWRGASVQKQNTALRALQ